MTELSPALHAHLFDVLLTRAQPLLFDFDGDWRQLGITGARAHWQAEGMHGDDLAAAVRDLFLHLDPEPVGVLLQVELPGERIAHVHWLRAESGWQVILLDARQETERQRIKQQEGNEAELANVERGKAVHKLQKLKSELERQRQTLEEANALKTAFMATLSHEFRTPLTSIFGYLHLLERRLQQDSDAQFALRAIRRGATHLFGLSENLLEFGRQETGEARLNVVRIDLRLFAEDLRVMFEPLAEEQGLLLGIQVECAPGELCLDEIKLKQVMINLLSNAVRYTPLGKVQVRLAWTGERLEIRVIDTGVGIPAQFLDSVFKPFNRGGPQGSRGAGLGLSIVRRLVEQMHGELKVTSMPGEGSEFFVALPPLALGRKTLTPAPRTQDEDWLLGGTALVIDDDPDLRELVRLLLEDLGYSVEVAASANDGFERAMRLNPDLVIVDLILPGLPGNAATYKLRTHGYRGHILTLSAAHDPDSRRAALAAGANQFLAKPLQIDDFVRAIRALDRSPATAKDQ